MQIRQGVHLIGREHQGESSLLGHVVAAARSSKILSYTQIWESTVNSVIGHSLVTYW